MTEAFLRVREMRHDQFDEARRLELAVFGGDESIGALLDELHTSWARVPELSFVGERNSDVCAHVLFTRAILDAPNQLVDVLVLSPVGVRPELQRQGIGTALISRLDDRRPGTHPTRSQHRRATNTLAAHEATDGVCFGSAAWLVTARCA